MLDYVGANVKMNYLQPIFCKKKVSMTLTFDLESYSHICQHTVDYRYVVVHDKTNALQPICLDTC